MKKEGNLRNKGGMKNQKLFTQDSLQDVEAAANQVGYDFSGVDKPQNEYSLYGLRYSEFVVPLVKAVQELDEEDKNQKEIIRSLHEENTNLQKQIDELKSLIANNPSFSNDPSFKTGVQESPEVLLGQNIPNPFDQSTLIPFRIPKNCKEALIVISESATGKIERVVPVACGETQLTLEAGTLASDSYSYSLYVDGKVVGTKQMVITK